MVQSDAPIFTPVPSKPNWNGDDALEHLKAHMQTACILELFTIPLYLAAAYSIKTDEASREKIIGVVTQEMLHLALAGNILRSIGGQPKLYGSASTYPQNIFYQNITMNLGPATQQNLKSFKELEAPQQPMQFMAATLLPEYHSIGEFYDSCQEGLNTVYERMGSAMFLSESFTKQFSQDNAPHFGADMKVIKTIEDARSSLKLIVEQGEGGPDVPDSHYRIFSGLLENGPIDCYPVIENPNTSSFQGQEIQKVMLASDAAFCYLLLSVEAVWRCDGDNQKKVMSNIHKLMIDVLKPLASFLVTQPLAGSEENAGAPFNLRQFPSTNEALSDFIALAEAASKAFASQPVVEQACQVVPGLFDLGNITAQN